MTGPTAPPLNVSSPLKLRPISLEGEKNLDQQNSWILVESKNRKKAKQAKIQLEDLGTSIPLEIRPVITQKAKKIQDRPAGLAPKMWHPAHTTLHVMACLYT